MDRTHAEDLDRSDPLRHLRDRFELPDGLIYLDGNSLGALPRGVRSRVHAMIDDEWGRDLVASWNTHGWWDLPAAVGATLAPLVGAGPASVSVGDSTSVQLFKLLVAAARLRPGRRTIVTEPGNFPTDSYIVSSVARTLGLTVRWWSAEETPDIRDVLDDDVAVVSLCHVDYRLGRMHDGAGVTAAVHDAGALMLWDVCHSAGAVDVDLDGWDTDLAVGCGYKYLNGGPGAPAFAYVHPRWHDTLDQPIAGWHGHADPFALERDYRPATAALRVQAGSVSLLGVGALSAALEAFDGVAMADVRAKSLALTDLFLTLVEERLAAHGVAAEAPREHARRGSQVCLRLPEAYGFVQALIRRQVVGDFREPDLARFGFAPLYTRFVNVHDAVERMVTVLESGEHERPENTARAAVT
ncbi:kynureninase [Haloactinopolyspora alba]|uniref:Kynureninase n=1 Tax=Haloactinopolyspora alba TaxID=648780 RepID=A0A2P8E5C1_9ACTN|nr:kynureninase [Haloactinopolyspora alba]PSL04665.1 kynureninase [Haloactinopolyspora alba]